MSIGEAVNVRVAEGRQRCFQYTWENYPDTEFISETHLDMIVTHHREDAPLDFLNHKDEPVVSAGITDKKGMLPFLGAQLIKYQVVLRDMTAF